MKKKDELPSNMFPIKKMVKIPVYSSVRYKNGKWVGEIEDYVETPADWLQENIKRKEH